MVVKCPYFIQNGPGILDGVKHNVWEIGCVSVFAYYVGFMLAIPSRVGVLRPNHWNE
jgi:hypothetical protein